MTIEGYQWTHTWSPRSKVGATCPKCDRIGHPTVALGRFAPKVAGFQDAAGGPVRATREEAELDVCARRTAMVPEGAEL